jgi:hypothetical protein
MKLFIKHPSSMCSIPSMCRGAANRFTAPPHLCKMQIFEIFQFVFEFNFNSLTSAQC